MSDPSNWQIAGPYTAAGAALTWNAWLTFFRDRKNYRLAVSWEPPADQTLPLNVQVSMGPDVAADAHVTLRNAGDSTLHDVTVEYIGGIGDFRMVKRIPLTARVDASEALDWWIYGGPSLRHPGPSHPSNDFLVTATYRRRARGAIHTVRAQLSRDPLVQAELLEPTRRSRIRSLIAVKARPTAAVDRRDDWR